ncbi:uncharacterized protein Gasu_59740 [Galdieria sulphuraria]|uniref:Uncharacterized protein n=1 Tax=Galdieria sulphuraria TaxID=130081 RepID=M2XRY4_GALSU|nr:uncharacterized protein Gasu_59740 [Galdieria sulphuraria]EME26413.1 hypothetical protein Gasu_59740 [Galdieria sulphuraria]|eukprot:XP_005702933.1 hypothetical protein Gasu_59740 [Galdieria sulphuraria]
MQFFTASTFTYNRLTSFCHLCSSQHNFKFQMGCQRNHFPKGAVTTLLNKSYSKFTAMFVLLTDELLLRTSLDGFHFISCSQ